MGFSGVGLRGVGSRHLRDYAVVNRTIGSDAVTTVKIAPETILEVDIAPGAVGSREIAANAISYIDQIKDNIIGSQHLGPDSVYGVKIQYGAVGSREIAANAISYPDQILGYLIGSEHLGVGAVGYEDQVGDNILGYGKLTAGLQGTLVGNPDTTNLHFEHGKTETLNNYTADSRVIGSANIAVTYGGLAYDQSNKRLLLSRYINKAINYLYTLGTTTFNLGSIKLQSVGTVATSDIVLAPDANVIWMTAVGKRYAYEFNATTGAVIGSLQLPSNNSYCGITFSSDKNRLWVAGIKTIPSPAVWYVYEIGTTTGNVLGSFVPPVANTIPTAGLSFAPDTNRLWIPRSDASTVGSNYLYEVGTTTGNTIGSFKSNLLTRNIAIATDKNRIWAINQNDDYIREIGTALGRGYQGTYVKFQQPFSQQPTVTIAQIDDLRAYSVFVMEPDLGSFWIKAGTYPAKAMWMAWGSR